MAAALHGFFVIPRCGAINQLKMNMISEEGA